MDRRTVLRAAGLALVGGLAAPRLPRAADSRVLRFVPQANLANLDPIWGTQYVVRNAGLLIWDTLYGVDSTLTPKPQMAEGHVVEDDFKTWTIKLRPGLTFHDNTPVLARDAVASLKRWMARDQMGQLIFARLDALEAVDDRTLRFKLSKPFQRLPFALGKNNSPMALIMPERIAATDPFKQIPDFIGSGPMKFARTNGCRDRRRRSTGFPRICRAARRRTGSRAASGSISTVSSGTSCPIRRPPRRRCRTARSIGGRRRSPIWSRCCAKTPTCASTSPIRSAISAPFASTICIRPSTTCAPAAAILFAASQEDWMRATVGEDDALWKPCPGFFTPGTALYTEDGGEPLKGARRYDEAKRLLGQSGYNGEKVVMLVAQDQAVLKAQGDVSADMMKRIGINVDYVALDWGTVGSRRAKKEPPSQGGWNIFHSWHAGADCVNPAPYTALATTGDKAWFGWPKTTTSGIDRQMV